MPNFIDYALPGASMASGIANSLINYQSQRETRDMQIDLMREQNKFQEKMYDRQLRDNSPMEQVRKLGAAGLNPSLAFSDSQGISTPSVGSPPSLSAPQTSFSDVALNAAQSLSLLSESNKSNEEAKGLSTDNMYRDAMNLVTLDKLDSERGLSDVQKAYYRALETITQRSAESQVEGFSLANMKTKFEMGVMREQMLNLRCDTAYKDALRQLGWRQDSRDAQRLQNDIKLTFSQMNLNTKMGTMYEKQGNMFDKQGEYYRKLGDKTFEEKLWITAQKNLAWMDEARLRQIFPYIKQEYENYSEASSYAPLANGVSFAKDVSQLFNPLWWLGYPLGGGASINYQGGNLGQKSMRRIGF